MTKVVYNKTGKILSDLFSCLKLKEGRGRDVSCQKRSVGDDCQCYDCCMDRAWNYLRSDYLNGK